MPARHVHLVRHGLPLVDTDAAASSWALDPAGAGSIRELRTSGRLPDRATWFCSPEPKARETARMLTDDPVEVVDAQREQVRLHVGWIADFDAVLAAAFAHPERPAYDGWQAANRLGWVLGVIAPADAVKNLGPRLGKDLLLVALLGLLMIFPAQLFNSTYSDNHERIDRTLGKVRRRRRMRAKASPIPLQRTGSEGADEEPVVLEAVTAPPARSTRIAVFLGCALAGTLLGGLLDPKFSAGTASYALLVGVFLAVVVAVLLSALSRRAFRAATHRPHDWYLRAIPSALMIAVLCVVVSRLAHFQPGYLYGVLGGAVFAVALERRSEGRAEAAVFLASLALALGAWLAFGAVLTAANGDHPSFGVLTADALLGSLFIGGVEGLLFGMVPLRFLPGYRVKGWSWIAWGLLTAVVLFTFVHVLLLPEAGYLGRSTVGAVNLTVGTTSSSRRG